MQFVFSQLDSWCFREARPMGALGGTAIETLFPPPVSTLVGACRTLMGDSQHINWRDFAAGKLPEMSALLGNGSHTGELQFDYPYLRVKQHGIWQRLYPVPALLAREDKRLLAMALGNEPVLCDLGLVRLPELAKGVFAAKPIENSWLTEQGLACLMAGKLPKLEHFIAVEQLMQREVRLGIARDNSKATVQKGALYQTEHVRLKEQAEFEQIELVVPVTGIPEPIAQLLIQQSWQVRLGGEGRLAHVMVEHDTTRHETRQHTASTGILYFTSPADLQHWLPAQFAAIQTDGVTQWQGKLGDVTVTIEAFCAAKAVKLGGWDSALRQPKPVKALVPAGACYFVQCTQPDKLTELLKQYRFGEQAGFGLGACLYLPRINA
ncbi:hypothetical protein VT06_13300 [Arsukibacterium sp. MJ3]|uniref:type III-B CRISPR module-associated Cmr3 family protein n=1 Tax=Arsukibacterium sp. MJ3 TaxID=1632859 RepID=UPI000626F59C|nr:type III-B CRISPR module-associated Cmr3 family protein [Arsukibacterium sp. MJ3]KKO48085.1 hypothetical protein VT06_13300 [Arsukibacterium sp. MJ3]